MIPRHSGLSPSIAATDLITAEPSRRVQRGGDQETYEVSTLVTSYERWCTACGQDIDPCTTVVRVADGMRARYYHERCW